MNSPIANRWGTRLGLTTLLIIAIAMMAGVLVLETGGSSDAAAFAVAAAPTTEKGDNDCDGDIDAVDALKGLKQVAGLFYGQKPGCIGIGFPIIDGPIPFDDFGMPILLVFGDADCDFDVDSVDSLLILRVLASLPINIPFLCEPIGSPI